MPLLPREVTSFTGSENQDGVTVGVSVPDTEGWGEAQTPELHFENHHFTYDLFQLHDSIRDFPQLPGRQEMNLPKPFG